MLILTLNIHLFNDSVYKIQKMVYSSLEVKSSINLRSTRNQLDFCPPPKNRDTSVAFLSDGEEENSNDIESFSEDLLSDYMDYENVTSGSEENYDDQSTELSRDIYPLETVVKFKCVRGADGKYQSWQIR